MTLLDLVLFGLLVIAVVSGWRSGLLARLGMWLGIVLGLAGSAWSVPLVLGMVEGVSPEVRFLAAVATAAGTVTVAAALLGTAGASLGRRVAGTALAGADRVGGALAGLVVVVIGTWLVLPVAAELPGTLGRQASDAATARLLVAHAPAPPDVGNTVRALVADSRFPEVIAELEPVRAAGPPPEEVALPPEVLARATAATVRVSARGCGARYDGSGVTIDHDLVLTNAHVVAGSNQVQVRQPDGTTRTATVVGFDPGRDLAVLRVPDAGQAPLPLGTGSRGQETAVIGYPGGQPEPRVAAARVQQQRTALGRDIYGVEETEREVLFLAAGLRPGDSGAPVVDVEGRVVGLVFAVSPDRPTTAYALDRVELDAVLAAPRVTGATGRCLERDDPR